MTSLERQFGPIDIYLFDQLLRGNIQREMKIMDAGCGAGRNLVYFISHRYDVYGVDISDAAIAAVRRAATHLPPENFRVEAVESMSFEDRFADVVISSAVLHFAQDDQHFEAMLSGSWKVLKKGGLFFCRLASSIGIENQIERIFGRQYRLPDGSKRYLVDEDMIMRCTHDLGGELMDPLKTTIVQNQRSMTTWVMRKQS